MRSNFELVEQAGGSGLAPAAAVVPAVPLDAIGAVNAVLDAISTLIVAIMVLAFVGLVLGAFGMFILGGLAYLNPESGQQTSARTYFKGTIVALACALVVLVGPEFLTQVGAPWPDQFNIVTVAENL